MQKLLDIIDEASEKVRLKFNIKKTVTMVIPKKQDTPTCNDKPKNYTLKQMESLK